MSVPPAQVGLLFKIYLAVLGPNCSIWNLVSQPGIEPRSPAFGSWSLNHRSTREVPTSSLLIEPHLFCCPSLTPTILLVTSDMRAWPDSWRGHRACPASRQRKEKTALEVHTWGLPCGPEKTQAAAAAAKSCQSCSTLCNPRDGSPPGSSVPGILQARTLEWVVISFSSACMHEKSLQSCLTLCDPMDSSPPGSSIHRIL